MTLITLLFILIVSGFAVISLFWTCNIIATFFWIKRARKINSSKKNTLFYVIIPVLHEGKRIIKTIKYFKETFKHFKKIELVIITTDAEFRHCKNPSQNTINIVKDLTKQYPSVVHYHYPKSDGKMAHQLNYGIKKIISENTNKNVWFGVYNADSQPHPNTFDWLAGYINTHKKVKVFQQYGDYTKNILSFTKLTSKPILWSAACWQNRWSAGFEIPHARRQFNRSILPDIFSHPLNYCIGHGLFFTQEIFNKLDGFSETTHNEDAIFGLKLSYFNEPIIPVPYFDVSDAPNNISGLFIQKANWFFGPLEAFKYLKIIITKHKGRINRIKLGILAAKLFLHSVYWICGPSLLCISFILAIINFSIAKIVLFGVTTFIFLPVINYLAWAIVTENKNIMLHIKSFFYNALGSFPCYILHGLSAYRTLFRIGLYLLINQKVVKEKTPMS